MAERALASAFVNIVPGTKDIDEYLKSKLSDDAEKAGDKAGQSLGNGISGGLKSAMKLAVGAFAAFSAGQFISDMVSSAYEGQKVDATLTQITTSMGLFGDSTDSVVSRLQAVATEQMKLTGVDDDAIKAAQAKLLTFKDVAASADTMGGSFDQATKLALDLSAAGFGSVDSAAVMLGKALNDPISGVTALRRVGVQLTDAQEEQIKSFIAVGDVAGAQNVIMQEVQRQVGGTAEASATGAEKMRARWDDFVQTLGTMLLPALDQVTSFMSDSVIPTLEAGASSMQSFGGWVKDNSTWLVPLGLALAIGAAGYTALGIAADVAAAGGLAKWMAQTKIATGIQAAFNLVMNANPISLIIIAIAALVAGLIWFFTQTDLGRQIWENVMNAIGAAFTWLWESVIQPVAQFIGEVITGIGQVFQWIWDNILNPIVQAIVLGIIVLGAIFSWLYDNVIKPVFDAIGVVFNWIWENVISPVVGWIKERLDVLGLGFKILYDSFVKPAIDAIGNVLKWLWDNVVSPVFKFIGDAVTNIGKTFGTVFGAIGDVVRNAFEGLIGIIRPPVNAIIGFINDAINAINAIKIDIPEWARGFFGGATSFSLRIPNIPKLADGGFVDRPTTALIGEAGPEVVTPLKDFERMMGLGNGTGQTVNYYAAPNESIDSEQALFTALKRAKAMAW